MTAPAWAPALADVAVHILSRTREVGVEDDYAGTFTASTVPTATQATILIGQACTDVAAKVGAPIDAGAEAQCALAAALWAAYWIELAQPERDADVAVYEKIRADAIAATQAAADLNYAFGGGSATDPVHVEPEYSFPDPPPWADMVVAW